MSANPIRTLQETISDLEHNIEMYESGKMNVNEEDRKKTVSDLRELVIEYQLAIQKLKE